MSPIRALYLSALAVCLTLAGAGDAKPISESTKSAATPAASQTLPQAPSQGPLPPSGRDSEARRANREDSLAPVWSVLLQHERQLATLSERRSENDSSTIRLVLSLIPQIVWAIVAVVLALLFREPVSIWIQGLKLSWGDFKAEPQTLAQVERKVNENASAAQVSPKDVRGWELIVLKLLEREFGGNMRPDVRLHDVPFDAVTWGSRQGRVIGIQIKFAATREQAQAQIAPLVATAEQIARTYHPGVFSVVLAFVVSGISRSAAQEREEDWQRLANAGTGMKVFVRVFDMATLSSEDPPPTAG